MLEKLVAVDLSRNQLKLKAKDLASFIDTMKFLRAFCFADNPFISDFTDITECKLCILALVMRFSAETCQLQVSSDVLFDRL